MGTTTTTTTTTKGTVARGTRWLTREMAIAI